MQLPVSLPSVAPSMCGAGIGTFCSYFFAPCAHHRDGYVEGNAPLDSEEEGPGAGGQTFEQIDALAYERAGDVRSIIDGGWGFESFLWGV